MGLIQKKTYLCSNNKNSETDETITTNSHPGHLFHDGIGRNGFSTVFPITMGMAASWDDALLHQVFTAVSDEARVKAQQAKRSGDIKRYQSLSFWTPNINIFRDPRWGRGQETYGEDPYLTTKMGLAVVRGLQGVSYNGEDLGISKYRKLLACAKHFAVHSGPEWNRHEFNVENLPDFLDYKMANRTYRYFKGELLFPFGFGLSYTNFEIGKPVYKNGKVQVNVKNTGAKDGLETVQVYLRNTADAEGPLKTLKAYSQVMLKAGESKTLTIDLPRSSFEGWDATTNTMRVVPGRYELMVGNSSADQDQRKILVDIK